MPSVYDHITVERVRMRVAQLRGRGSAGGRLEGGRLVAVMALADAMRGSGAASVGELPDDVREQHAEAIADVGSPGLQWLWQRVPR